MTKIKFPVKHFQGKHNNEHIRMYDMMYSMFLILNFKKHINMIQSSRCIGDLLPEYVSIRIAQIHNIRYQFAYFTASYRSEKLQIRDFL